MFFGFPVSGLKFPLMTPRLCLLAALLLVPFMITNDSLWLDEGDTARYALQPDFHAWSHWLRHDGQADCQMPLALLCSWVAAKLWGTAEWQLRAVNVLWGALALAGMYRVGKRLQLPGLPLLLALQPYFWFYTNEARPYGAGGILRGAGGRYHLGVAAGRRGIFSLLRHAARPVAGGSDRGGRGFHCLAGGLEVRLANGTPGRRGFARWPRRLCAGGHLLSNHTAARSQRCPDLARGREIHRLRWL